MNKPAKLVTTLQQTSVPLTGGVEGLKQLLLRPDGGSKEEKGGGRMGLRSALNSE